MHQLREQHQPGQFTVPLRAKHADIRMDSQSNLDWNLRTLLLMQRAGFIDITYPPPDLSAIAPDERDESGSMRGLTIISTIFRFLFSVTAIWMKRSGGRRFRPTVRMNWRCENRDLAR